MGLLLVTAGFYEFELIKKLRSADFYLENLDPLQSYAKDMLSMGFSKDHIKEELEKAGWENLKIEKTLNKL